MLQIRLNKGNGSEGGAPNRAPGFDNVTVSCPDHLVLADLLVAKGVGAVSNVKVVKTIGRKRRRRPGEKVHICLCCDFPIAIYGRLSPCEHAFCSTCARSEPSCYLCDERIQKIQTIKMLDGVFICGAPHCWRSFLNRYDFEQHLKEAHLDLLQTAVEKEEVYQRDVKPHAESQALSHSVSAPPLQTSQQAKNVPLPQASSPPEKQLQHIQSIGSPVSLVTSLPEKQAQVMQSRGLPGTPARSPPEQQPHQNQSRLSTSWGKRQDQEQLEQKQSSYQQHYDNQVNTSAGPQQQSQAKNHVSENSPRDYYHRQPQGEIHHMYSETHQIPHSGNQYSQQQENRHTDGFIQHNLPYQTLMQRPPPPPPTNPPFPNYPFSHSYPMPPEGQPQQLSAHFDPRFGPATDEMAIQAGIQSIQENNQSNHAQISVIPETHGNSHITHTAGISVMATIPGPQEGYIHQDRSGPFSHIQGDLGQVPAGSPFQVPPQGGVMGFNQSLHYQDLTYGSEMPPLPNHRNYQNISTQGEGAANYGSNGMGTNFGGHGYGSWSGPQSHA